MQTNADQLRETHGKRIDKILNLLNDISQWYSVGEEQDIQINMKAFANLEETFRTGEYTIVMVGEFSTGKSTLLNALMGEQLLPSFKTETTATVNFLRHTEKAEKGEKGCVFYKDNTKQILDSVDYKVIEKYVSTRGENVANHVAHLDLFLDSKFLRDNVTLIDSPGLNGVAEGHKDITYQQILKSHACIFVFSSDHPGSKSDFEFLADLKSNVGTILFVLNKIDEIKEDEGETPATVIHTIQENYKKFFPNSECPEIWPLASLPALVARSSLQKEYRGKKDYNANDKEKLLNSSNIQKFEARLMEFLTMGEKTKRQELEPIERVIVVGGKSKTELENEIHLLGQADDTSEIEKNIVAVKDAIKNCEAELSSCYSDVSAKVRTCLRDVTEAIDADINRYTERSITEINSFDNLDDINQYLKRIGDNYNNYVKTLLSKYDDTLRDGIIEQVFTNYHSFAERIKEAVDGVNGGLSLSVELNTKEYVFSAGLATLEQQEIEARQQLEQLRTEEKDENNNKIKATVILRKQQKIEERLRDIEGQREVINSHIMPTIINTTKKEERDRTFKEKGLLGAAVELFVGAKPKIVEVIVTDDRVYKEESTKRNVDIQKLEEEKKTLKAALNNFAYEDALMVEEKHSRASAALVRAEEKYAELIKKNREEFQSKYNIEIKKARNELHNLFSDKTFELIIELKKILREQEKKYTSIVCSVVMANLKQALVDEQKKKETLLARLNSSENERDLRIEKLNKRLDELNNILEDAKAIKTELEGLSIENVN